MTTPTQPSEVAEPKGLKVSIVEGVLSISIDKDTLKFFTENLPGLYDGQTGTKVGIVTDPDEWIRSICEVLTKQDEMGQAPIRKLLDDAILLAFYQDLDGFSDE